jgi:hypothetical protein
MKTEEIIALRQAFVELRRAFCSSVPADEAAKIAYPMPTVTRPRVVSREDFEYKIVDGRVLYRHRQVDVQWWVYISEDMLAVLQNLLANPTEEVESP